MRNLARAVFALTTLFAVITTVHAEGRVGDENTKPLTLEERMQQKLSGKLGGTAAPSIDVGNVDEKLEQGVAADQAAMDARLEEQAESLTELQDDEKKAADPTGNAVAEAAVDEATQGTEKAAAVKDAIAERRADGNAKGKGKNAAAADAAADAGQPGKKDKI